MVHHDTYICHEYLERLTRTGPKRLHVLFKHILSKFSVYNMNAHAHTQTRTHTYPHTHAHTHQSHIRAIRTMRLKTRCSKRGFQGRFKRADRGRMADKNRELVPDNEPGKRKSSDYRTVFRRLAF